MNYVYIVVVVVVVAVAIVDERATKREREREDATEPRASPKQPPNVINGNGTDGWETEALKDWSGVSERP